MNRTITITVTTSSYNVPDIEELWRLEEALASYDQENVKECQILLDQNRRLSLLLDRAPESHSFWGGPSTLDAVVTIAWNNRQLDILDPTCGIRATLADLRRAKASHVPPQPVLD